MKRYLQFLGVIFFDRVSHDSIFTFAAIREQDSEEINQTHYGNDNQIDIFRFKRTDFTKRSPAIRTSSKNIQFCQCSPSLNNITFQTQFFIHAKLLGTLETSIRSSFNQFVWIFQSLDAPKSNNLMSKMQTRPYKKFSSKIHLLSTVAAETI